MDGLLTTYQAASLTGLSHTHVCRLCRTGKLPAIRFGHAWMIAEQDAMKLLEEKAPRIAKDELEYLYWKRELSITDIANETGISRMAIYRLMVKFGIPRRAVSAHMSGPKNPIKNLTGTRRQQWRERLSEAKKGKALDLSPDERERRSAHMSKLSKELWENGTFGSEEWQEKQRQSHAGENCWRWNGGAENYRGPNWQRQRQQARARDDFTCQRCGITERELGQELDVHHILPYSQFPDHEKANCLSNLTSYCKTCHAIIEHNA